MREGPAAQRPTQVDQGTWWKEGIHVGGAERTHLKEKVFFQVPGTTGSTRNNIGGLQQTQETALLSHHHFPYTQSVTALFFFR